MDVSDIIDRVVKTKDLSNNENYDKLLSLLSQLCVLQEHKRSLALKIINAYQKRRRMRLSYHQKSCEQMKEICSTLLSAITKSKTKRKKEKTIRKRAVWKYDRPCGSWFEELLAQEEKANWWWKEHLHVSRDTFLRIVEMVRPYMTSKDTPFRKATTVERKVAACLWRIGNGDIYRNISTAFGIGESSIHIYCSLFFDTIVSLKETTLTFPSNIEAVTQFFSETTKIPNVVGILDTLHVLIIQPAAGKSEHYFNREEHEYGVLLQCVVGPQYLFMDAFVGPGGLLYDSLLEMSSFGEKMKNGTILQKPEHKINENISIKPLVLADSKYTLRSWLLPPYLPQRNKMTDIQNNFNNHHCKGNEISTEAFKLLKGRWKIITKEQTESMKRLHKTLLACIILHNICIMSGDDTEINTSEFDMENEEQSEKKKVKKGKNVDETLDAHAVMLRNVIAENL